MTRDIDWGVPVPVDGYPEDTKRIYVWFDAVIGYLSASVEWAHNRGTPDAWREWWQNPEARHYYFMGKDNIVFHSVIWPAMLLGYDAAASSAPGGRPPPADERRRERVPDDGGQEGEHQPQPRDLGRRLPQPLRPRPAALLPHRRRAGDAGHRLHVGRVRAPQQRRAGRELGQPRQPHARERAPQLRRGSRARRADRSRPRVLDGVAAAFATSARTSRARASAPRSPRRCARARSRTSTSPSRRRGRSSRPTATRAATVLYVALRAVDSLKTLLAPVPALHVAGGARAPRLRRLARRPARVPHRREEDGSTHRC